MVKSNGQKQKSYPRVGEYRKAPIKLWLCLNMERGIRLMSELIHTGTDVNRNGQTQKKLPEG